MAGILHCLVDKVVVVAGQVAGDVEDTMADVASSVGAADEGAMQGRPRLVGWFDLKEETTSCVHGALHLAGRLLTEYKSTVVQTGSAEPLHHLLLQSTVRVEKPRVLLSGWSKLGPELLVVRV